MEAEKFREYIKIFEDNHGILKLSRAIKSGIPKQYLFSVLTGSMLKAS